MDRVTAARAALDELVRRVAGYFNKNPNPDLETFVVTVIITIGFRIIIIVIIHIIFIVFIVVDVGVDVVVFFIIGFVVFTFDNDILVVVVVGRCIVIIFAANDAMYGCRCSITIRLSV